MPVITTAIRTWLAALSSRAGSLLLAVTLLATACAHAQTVLIVGITENQQRPYIELEHGALAGGLLKALVDELGAELGIEVEYRLLPRKRLQQQLLAGQLHLLPHANPAWLPDADAFFWSAPWIEDRDVLIVRRDEPGPITDLHGLSGRRIGTILGYHYPELDFFFEHRMLLRDDGHDLRQNLERLAARRIDLLVDSEVMIDDQLRQMPHPERFRKLDLIVANNPRHLALSKHAPISIEQLERALQALRQQGRITELLERYR